MTVVDLEPVAGVECGRTQVQALAGRVMAAAGDLARQEAMFLDLVGGFDAVEGWRFFDGLGSTAAWLAWACSLAPSTAREHVRVARALRRMPATQAAFARGELTYSKVRAMTRLVDQLAADRADEDQLVALAREATAAQLDDMISGYRSVAGTAAQRRSRQRVSWVQQDDGTIHLSMVLPPEHGAAVIAAIQAATDADRDPVPQPGDVVADDAQAESAEQQRERSKVEAVVEIANHYLASRPEDRSGEDRNLVVIEVNATALQADDAPAGASDRMVDQRCRVRGGAAVEPDTAQQAVCDGTVLGVVIDRLGEPLAVGRQQRLVTRAQRRALMIRDQSRCQYPGCARRRHLKAHHRISWLAGGPTDLDNLILLCQRHHTRVHEEQISISVCSRPSCVVRWRFARADGTPIIPIVSDAERAEFADLAAEVQARYGHIDHYDHPDAESVFPRHGGEGYLRAECVDALFRIAPPEITTAA